MRRLVRKRVPVDEEAEKGVWPGYLFSVCRRSDVRGGEV